MKDEITITKKELTQKLLIASSRASSRASSKIQDKAKNPQAQLVVNLLNTVLIGEILKILFDEGNELEIVEDE